MAGINGVVMTQISVHTCVATRHLSLQRHRPVMSVPPVANVPPPYVRSQLLCTLTLPCNVRRQIPCPGYTFSALCPISITSLHDFSLQRPTSSDLALQRPMSIDLAKFHLLTRWLGITWRVGK